MNYADIKTVDVQDGTGVRVSLYVSGCHFHCKGCHNKEAWDFNYGKKFNEDTIDYIIELLKPSYIAGLSLLGGEPLEEVNQKELINLVEKVKEIYPQKTIWCYTGYRFKEDIFDTMYLKSDITKRLLNNIDIIVDGQFVESKKLIDLKFRGSTNQNKIDVKESINQKRVIKLKFGDESRYELNNNVIYREITLRDDIDEVVDNNSEKVIKFNEYYIEENKKQEIKIEEEKEKIAAQNIDNVIKNQL